MSSWDDDKDPVDENAAGIESSGDFSDFSDSEFSALPSDDEVFSGFTSPEESEFDAAGGYSDEAADDEMFSVDDHPEDQGDEPGMGITTWDPDADDEYLGEDPPPTPDHVAGEGLADEFGEYDPSRGDDAPQPIPQPVEPDSSVGWPIWAALAVIAVVLIGGAGTAAWYFTKDDDGEPQAAPETSETIAEWPSGVATPPGGAGSADEEEDLAEVIASLEADRNRLASENEELRANGAGEAETSTRTETRTETKTETRTSTSTLPRPPARTVTETAPAPAPRVVTNTVTSTPPPRVVTNTVTSTTTISGGRVTVTRTIINRP